MRSLRLFTVLLTSAALMAAPGPVRAEEPDAPDDVDEFREAVRGGVQSFAAAVDSFFSDSEYEEERNETRLSLKFGAQYLTKDDWDFHVQPGLRLRLPNIEKRLLLEIVGERGTSDSTNPFFLSEEFDSSDDQTQNLELRLKLLQDSGDVRLAPEVGVRFSDNMPQAFVGVRARREWRLSENWALYGSQRLRVHTDRGMEANTVIRADRPITVGSRTLFRTSFNFDWRADEPGVTYRPGVSLFTPLDEQSALAFETSVRFETDPEHQVDVAVATVRYRRKLFYDWWTAEIAPRVEFAEEHDYEASYGARLQLELDF